LKLSKVRERKGFSFITYWDSWANYKLHFYRKEKEWLINTDDAIWSSTHGSSRLISLIRIFTFCFHIVLFWFLLDTFIYFTVCEPENMTIANLLKKSAEIRRVAKSRNVARCQLQV
jgi:hypothetical protein